MAVQAPDSHRNLLKQQDDMESGVNPYEGATGPFGTIL